MSTTSDSDLIAIWPTRNRFASIVWQVSDVCNFRCSYCNDGNWGGKYRNLDTDKYISVLDQILNYFIAKGYQSFKIFFSGGEPTVWRPLIPICEFIQSKVDRPLLAINTNLSRPLSWWKENHHFFRDIVASYHVENTSQKRYLENMKFLQYHKHYLACRMLMHDERFSEVADFAETLKRELDNYLIEYAPLFEKLSPHSEMHLYKEEWKNEYLQTHQLESQRLKPIDTAGDTLPASCEEVYRDGTTRSLNSNRIVAEGKNNFKGWECSIEDSIFISPRGDIRLASCGAGRVIGNMNLGKVKLGGGPVLCTEMRCNCGTDIYIPKVRPRSKSFLQKQGWMHGEALT